MFKSRPPGEHLIKWFLPQIMIFKSLTKDQKTIRRKSSIKISVEENEALDKVNLS